MSRKEMSVHILRKVVVDGFLLSGLVLILYAVKLLWPTFQRGFFCGDESLMFPYHENTVTVLMMRVVGLALPTLSFLICEWSILRREQNDTRCFGVPIPTWIRGLYCVLISYAIGLCFTEITTEIGKKVIGRPRPHFFDVCQPSVDCNSPSWQSRYVQAHEYTCTGDQTDKFGDMRKSFPSGHSSWAAYTMIYFALYLQQRMVWRGTRIVRHVLQFAAVMMSWFTALSRVPDYKHHWSDVLAGYTLGATIAVLVWNWGTDLVQKEKHHCPLSQHEVNISSLHQLPSYPA